ncbi:MAG TPA: energy transducer TonB [Cytophagaceae bacterium]|nr:energy transducer TonB [Cytophagaceae bacterium]
MKILFFFIFLFVSQISFAQDWENIDADKGITVTVIFTIDTLGKITNVKARPNTNIDEKFLQDAERIVMSMAPFEPQMENGILVAGRRRVDINFNSEKHK